MCNKGYVSRILEPFVGGGPDNQPAVGPSLPPHRYRMRPLAACRAVLSGCQEHSTPAPAWRFSRRKHKCFCVSRVKADRKAFVFVSSQQPCEGGEAKSERQAPSPAGLTGLSGTASVLQHPGSYTSRLLFYCLVLGLGTTSSLQGRAEQDLRSRP